MKGLFVIISLMGAAWCSAQTLHVSAAISLKQGLTEVAKAYRQETGAKVDFNFGASGQLAEQIRHGAPIDLLISADLNDIRRLVAERLVDPASAQVVARNRLVLIVPADAGWPEAGFEGLKERRVHRVAIGDPQTVPAGRYAMQTLDSLGLTADVKSKLLYGANVRQVLDYVENKEVQAGIVYSSEARDSGDKVKVVATAEEKNHDPIDYVAGIVSSGKEQASHKFLDYLGTAKARAIMVGCGLLVPTPAAAPAP